MKIYEAYLLCTFLSYSTEKFFKITIDFLSWSIKAIKAIKVISVKRLLGFINYTAFKKINKEV